MKNICVFAGTTEGRRLVEFLSSKDARVFACVATDYGEALLEGLKNIETSAKRMDSDEMTELFERERFDLVIDATHPYASIVTENIRLACARTCTEYLRLERESAEDRGEQSFSSVDDAVSYLNGTEGIFKARRLLGALLCTSAADGGFPSPLPRSGACSIAYNRHAGAFFR